MFPDRITKLLKFFPPLSGVNFCFYLLRPRVTFELNSPNSVHVPASIVLTHFMISLGSHVDRQHNLELLSNDGMKKPGKTAHFGFLVTPRSNPVSQTSKLFLEKPLQLKPMGKSRGCGFGVENSSQPPSSSSSFLSSSSSSSSSSL